MIALAGVELETLLSEPDALTTRPPQLSHFFDLNSKSAGNNFFSRVLSLELLTNIWSEFQLNWFSIVFPQIQKKYKLLAKKKTQNHIVARRSHEEHYLFTIVARCCERFNGYISIKQINRRFRKLLFKF